MSQGDFPAIKEVLNEQFIYPSISASVKILIRLKYNLSTSNFGPIPHLNTVTKSRHSLFCIISDKEHLFAFAVTPLNKNAACVSGFDPLRTEPAAEFPSTKNHLC